MAEAVVSSMVAIVVVPTIVVRGAAVEVAVVREVVLEAELVVVSVATGGGGGGSGSTSG